MLSIIIPTLNEGDHIHKLMDSIAKQKFDDYEVIVVDGKSVDNTRDIIKKYKKKIKKLKIIIEPKRGIPLARNIGAKNAKGDYYLFLDADVVLGKDFLEKTTKEFKERDLDIATCYMDPISKRIIDKILHGSVNILFFFTQYFSPRAPGFCIFSTKKIYKKAKGFNEKLKFGEDHDYVQRAGKHGKFRVLKSSVIPVSVRRLDKEGRWNIVKKYVLGEIYRIRHGEITEELFEYEFGSHE